MPWKDREANREAIRAIGRKAAARKRKLFRANNPLPIKNYVPLRLQRMTDAAEVNDRHVLRVFEKMGISRKICKANPGLVEAKKLQLKIKNLL